MYMLFQKRPERALIGACALIRPNSVYQTVATAILLKSAAGQNAKKYMYGHMLIVIKKCILTLKCLLHQ